MAQLAAALMSGQPASAPYSLDDMAQDAFGLISALEIESAHICGASMGGMIVQAMALQDPKRVRSLTSIMSSTGNPELPSEHGGGNGGNAQPAGDNRDEAIERTLRVSRVIGSPGYPVPDEIARARAAEAFDRSFHPQGVARQMAAIAAHGNRKPRLATLKVPALVIHGAADPLVPKEGGVDTHEALRGSRLLILEGMGHDLPEPLWAEIHTAVTDLTGRG